MNSVSFTSIKHVTGSPENCKSYKNGKLPEDYMKAVLPLNDLYGKKDAATEEYGVFDGQDAAKLYKDLFGLEVPETVIGKPSHTALKDLWKGEERWHAGEIKSIDFNNEFIRCKEKLSKMIENKSEKLKQYWENSKNIIKVDADKNNL